VDRVHVDDQVLDHRHVAHRLDRDDPVLGGLLGVLEVVVAGESGLPVDAHPAGAADGGAARTPDPDRPVRVRLDLEDALQHRAVRLEVDLELLPVRRIPGLRGVAADPQRVLGH
jgi:hypothetical protein